MTVPNLADRRRHDVTNITVLPWSVGKTGDRLEVKTTNNLRLKPMAAGWRSASMGVSLPIPPSA